MLKEFKEFALKGSAVDLAVGVIIGAAFGKIVSALVDKVFMPPLGLLVGGMDFSDLKLILRAAGPSQPEVAIGYGAFVQASVNFLIVAVALFVVIKFMNAWRSKPEPTAPAAPPPTPEDVLLLREIRDALKKS